MESINSFSQGQNSDQSKTILNKETYLQALNFRPLTELGSSNGSLVNIKGNECKLTFPDLQPVFKIEVIEGSLETSNPTDITINGVTDSIDILNTTTGFDLYTFITSNFPNCYQYTGTTIATKTFAVAYEDNYIVIYNQPVYQDCTTVASIAPTIVLTPDEDDGTRALLYFINQNAANSLTQNTANPYVAGCPSSLVKPIGSTFILNDIYILTATDNPTYGPAGAPNEIPSNDELKFGGAIWKLNIDDITKQHTLTLVYSNNLDFTKYHPIPPSAITGRYESIDIKRIYWSDNYNKIRTINTAAPQLMALNPSQLSIIPKVEFVQPTLKSIGTGLLTAGCYQLSYRLSKVLGSVTNYSELSAPVYLTANPESTVFHDYEGALGGAGKSITWYLSNLDTTYDQIETVVVYRSSAGAVPVITSMGLDDITETKDITYSNASTTSYSEVTLDEFLLFNGTFTHAKTCDTKDNRLFWGNVRAPRKDLEFYDARAFRASSIDGKIKLKNNGTNSDYTLTIGDPNYAPNLAQTEDTINEYYDSAGNYSADACYLKPSTYGTTNILGGEGINISYEFGAWSISADTNLAISNATNYDINSPGPGYRTNGTDSSIITFTEYEYPQNSKYFSLKQPEKTSLIKGFQHEEIYRFGIQFFDKEGNPYFTKWIGDIKMPSYGDTNPNPDFPATLAGISDFRLSFNIGTADLYTQALYVKFTVNISSINDLISGYQIVRVKREGSDKTILGAGMINPFESNDPSLSNPTVAILPASWNTAIGNFTVPIGPILIRRYYNPYPDQWHVETLNANSDTAGFVLGQFKMFDCWDFDAGLRPSYSSGDKILIRSRVKAINYNGTTGSSGYRAFFVNPSTGAIKGRGPSGQIVPPDNARINDGSYGQNPPIFIGETNNDSGPIEPFFILKMVDDTVYSDYTDFLGTNANDYALDYTEWLAGNTSTSRSSYSIENKGIDITDPAIPLFGQTGDPCYGKGTLLLQIPSGLSTVDYGCIADSTEPKKLLALYYKPNISQYGGATYINRSNNEYIPSGEFIPTTVNNSSTNQNLTFTNFGGDVFTAVYDMMKTVKSTGAKYTVFVYVEFPSGSGIWIPKIPPIEDRLAKFSTSFFFGTTCSYNSEVRLGNHPNRSINGDGGYGEDDYSYETYNNAENDVKTYFPKPLNFQTSEEWINRIYWSEIKFNNEIQDSWSVYLTDSFYDVEGNYGPINALVSLRENMYYLQERGVGSLMINPVSLINDQMGQPIKLGGSAPTSPVIQKHYYKSIDTGTFHQWSVYRSQSTITFVDARHKKIYLFNGESVSPISDIKGQRNFVIKRLHNELLKFDNPVINKGVLTTYDYYHNEFLYTFNNELEGDTINNENLTLAYSEILNAFTGMYSFTPNLYINSNKYLISTKNSNVGPYYPSNKLWFHNYGAYGSFYGTVYPSTLKLLINDNPLYTKVFDNMTIESEAIDDNVEWNDDLNVYPGSPTNPLYPDDVNIKDSTFQEVRCYNQYQNTDWTTLTIAPPGNNIRKVEQGFNLQLPRNKFDYDTYNPSTYSIFDPSKLTKTTFGERLRDKWLIADFKYNNLSGLRFIIHNIKTLLRISDR